MLSGMLPVLLAMTLAEAASSRFVLYGHVADPTGAPVADARVAAVPSDAHPPAQTRTDAAGGFSLTLPSGVYRVTVTAAGFADKVSTVVGSGDEAEERQFVLELPGYAETVTVRAPGGYEAGAITSGTRTL